MTEWFNATIRERSTGKSPDIDPTYKLVDTCAAEFEAATPYYYSTYETPYRRLDRRQSGTV